MTSLQPCSKRCSRGRDFFILKIDMKKHWCTSTMPRKIFHCCSWMISKFNSAYTILQWTFINVMEGNSLKQGCILYWTRKRNGLSPDKLSLSNIDREILASAAFLHIITGPSCWWSPMRMASSAQKRKWNIMGLVKKNRHFKYKLFPSQSIFLIINNSAKVLFKTSKFYFLNLN